MSRRDLERSGYLWWFANLLGCVCTMHGSGGEIRATTDGEIRTACLQQDEFVLSPPWRIARPYALIVRPVGAKRGRGVQAIGRSRGSPTTKIHALADGEGRLYAMMITAGQVHNVVGGRVLLARVLAMRGLIADKAYDANDLRGFLAAQGTEAVISPMARRIVRPRLLRPPTRPAIPSSGRSAS